MNHKKPKEAHFLNRPTKPLPIDRDSSVAGLLEKMAGTSFQGRSLGEAYQVWTNMLKDRTTIMMGMAGAMVPAGMRRLVAYMLKYRLIDCLVTTGANLFHDAHETLGRYHYQGSPTVDDELLQDLMIDRMYDVYASEREFRNLDAYIGDFAASLDNSRSYTTREFFYHLGKRLAEQATEDGIIVAAYKAKVPIYCPAIVDSSYGIAIASHRYLKGNTFHFDLVQDVVETARLAAESKSTGVIYFGGGTPKNFIQQTEVTAAIMKANVAGHKYAMQVITDAAHWGGLSGCTFEEAQSWGKIMKGASRVTVHCDSTIAMPMLVTALAHRAKAIIKSRHKPEFGFGHELTIKA
ncbi:MAG: deoxyhypusine synthase [Acidobacteria bacterium]|nr:deoxyhypusine synthase [Acidobacteriota bacterium]MBI3656747.1 deoxyhypusine synthase [Acidobacteriota bacterium]